MREGPLLSVIIPVYNGAPFIQHALNSLRNQTFQNWECFVVDDGSTDDTVAIVRHLGSLDDRIVLVPSTGKNEGAGAAFNRGLLATRGNYIAYLAADDWWHPWMADDAAECLEKTPGAFGVYTDFQTAGMDGFKRIRLPDFDKKLLWRRCYINLSAVVFRFDVAIPLFHPTSGAADWDFLLKTMDLYDGYVHLPRALSYRRVHPGQLSVARSGKVWLDSLKVLWNNSPSYALGTTRVLRRVAEKVMVGLVGA